LAEQAPGLIDQVALTDSLIRGSRWQRNAIRLFEPTFRAVGARVLFQMGQSTTFLTVSFGIGFTFSYLAGSQAGQLFDAINE